MILRDKIIVIVFFCGILFLAWPVLAAVDSDGDKVSDEDESHVYYTDPHNADTDNDGFDDFAEIKNNYSPRDRGKKMSEADFDSDGLNDRLERLLGTDLGKADTDNDGFSDGEEIFSGYDPRDAMAGARYLGKRIQIGVKEQRLRMAAGNVILAEYSVSTGTYNFPTPLGNFKVDRKTARAWSGKWKLWMPWFLALRQGEFGIHELPEWPGGKKEGEDHLGKRASHGCVRLGVGPAKIIYDWADVGTAVAVQKSLK